MRLSKFGAALAMAAILAAVGCGGSGGGGGGSDSSGLTTLCGVNADGSLRNPVSPSRGSEVTLSSVIDSNAVIVHGSDGDIQVKLQGLGDTLGFDNTAAQKLYQSLTTESLYYFPAGCTAPLSNGQTGSVGQVVTASGKSFSEQVITTQAAGVIETSGSCGEELLTTCYKALADSNKIHTTPVEPCTTMPSTVSYSPADSRCGGVASVTLGGDYADAFSVQLRYADGSDRLDEDCSTASCAPYKVHDYVDAGSSRVACFGASGDAVVMGDVAHVSIKMAADDHTPDRFCIADPTKPIN